MVMNKSLQVDIPIAAFERNLQLTYRTVQEVNIQNMNIELVAQMFKNYQSNVLFHLEGKIWILARQIFNIALTDSAQPRRI